MAATTSSPPADLPKEELRFLSLPDGRTLAYSAWGTPLKESRHLPVFYFHGHPMSRLECVLFHRTALQLGLHMVATDRPGYGRSTFQENRKLRDWPKDILALADHLNFDEFGIMGTSGGGPYVFACLRDIPASRLKAATVLAGIYPVKFGTAGMLTMTRVMLWASAWSTGMVASFIDFGLGRGARDTANPDALEQLIRTQMDGNDRPEVDRKAFKEMLDDPEKGHFFVEALREGATGFCKGAAWEMWLFRDDWGFELEDVDASRLTVWHGALDVNVPVAMADKAAELLRGVKYWRFDTEGHFSLPFYHAEEILSDLCSRLS